ERLGADVLDRDDIVAEVERRAAIVDRDDVIRRSRRRVNQRIIVLGRVKSTTSGQNLADSDELTGIVDSVTHEWNQVLHAVVRGDLRAGAVDVLPYADAHVQPLVAIDQIVAVVTCDDIAAIAAQDDVARAERGHAVPEEFLQAVDQRDIGEDAPPGGDIGEDSGGLVIADQDVIA